jgi:L-asparaginase
MSRKKILVIYTGGTIGMVLNKKDNAWTPCAFKSIYKELPMLNLLDAEITFKTMKPLIDSSNINPDFWIRLATLIHKNYQDYNGFVVLHGTDTMSYTASALSFLLENLDKPVILTGSQLPLGVMRTDGRENILNSIEIAADSINGKPRVQEVCIYFENALYRGNRTYKDNAEDFNAFMSANYPKLAEVGVNIKYNDKYIHHETEKKELILYKKMDKNIAVIKLYPGINKELLRTILLKSNIKAAIMETYGSGNAPSDPEFLEILESACQKGIHIVSITQCKGGGTVELGRYETSVHLKDIGVISGYDITTEAAVCKMMYLLGSNYSHEEVRNLMSVSLRGEMTVNE